ncbi:MAG: hypothetical protein V3V09_04800, partial [Arenicellales bacterium]
TMLRQEFTRNIGTKMAAIASMPVTNALKKRMDPRRFNGASLVGLNGIVVKSHGGTDAFGFESAIKVAIKEVKENMIDGIKSRISHQLS